MYYVYKATHKGTSKIYIGRTKHRLEIRIGQHWADTARSHKYFHQFLKTTKIEDWIWEILVTVKTKEEARAAELYYINLYNTYEIGFNSKPGFGSTNYLTRREELSQRMKKYRKENPEPWNKGKTQVYSEETLELMRLAKLRNPTHRNWSEEQKLEASVKARNRKQVKELKTQLLFNSISAAARHFNITRESVRDVVSKRRSHTQGYVFIEVHETNLNLLESANADIVERKNI